MVDLTQTSAKIALLFALVGASAPAQTNTALQGQTGVSSSAHNDVPIIDPIAHTHALLENIARKADTFAIVSTVAQNTEGPRHELEERALAKALDRDEAALKKFMETIKDTQVGAALAHQQNVHLIDKVHVVTNPDELTWRREKLQVSVYVIEADVLNQLQRGQDTKQGTIVMHALENYNDASQASSRTYFDERATFDASLKDLPKPHADQPQAGPQR